MNGPILGDGYLTNANRQQSDENPMMCPKNVRVAIITPQFVSRTEPPPLHPRPHA